jgi:hypothetical protein
MKPYLQADTGGYGGIQGDTAPRSLPDQSPEHLAQRARQILLEQVRHVSQALVATRESGYTRDAFNQEQPRWKALQLSLDLYRARLDDLKRS